MANPYKLSITISADTQEASSNIDRLNTEFGDLLKSLGKTPEDIRAFSKLAQDFIATGKAADDLDRETRRLLESYRDLLNVAKSRDILGLVPHDQIAAQIREVEEAFDSLKASGVLSQKEIAQASVAAQRRISDLKRQTNDFSGALQAAKAELAGLAAAGGGLTLAIRQAMDFESAMAEVAKVTSATDEQIKNLGKEIKDLTRTIPMSADELARLAAAGGQLGIPIQHLKQFTELAAQMGIAFNMGADEAGQSIARLMNVFGLTLDQVTAVGDAINTLGNNMATTERDIVEVMTRIGGSSKQFGLAADQAAALGAAMLALGKTPEVAATGINALLAKLQTAQVAGKDFQEALQRIGIDAEQLAASIRENPQRAVLDFLKTLQQIEPMARSEILVKLFGLEYQDDINALIGSLGQYERALGLVSDRQRTAGAMQEEFQRRLKTTETQIKLLQNSVEAIAINIGSTFLPAVNRIAGGLSDASRAIADFAERFPLITQLATTLATVAAAAGALKAAFLAARLAGISLGMDAGKAIASMNLPIGQAIGALGRLNSAFAVISAFLVGWDIGKWLSDEFEIVRKSGVFMVEALVKGFEHLRYAWEVTKAVFTDDTIDEATRRHEERLQQMSTIFDEMYREVEDGSWKASQSAAQAAQASADSAKQTVQETARAMQEIMAQAGGAVQSQAADVKAQLESVVASGKAAAESLDQVMQAALAERDYTQIEALVLGLDKVRMLGEEAAATVDQRLAAALQKLSAQDLADFQSKAEIAFESAGRDAEDFAWVLEAGVSASLSKLGVDVGKFRSGMTGAEKDAVTLFESVASSATASSEMILAAFDSVIGKVQSMAAIDFLRVQLQDLGASGALSVDQVARAMTRLDQAAGDAARALDPVSQAMERLGVESAAELDRLAEQARRDFELIRDSGTATAGEVAQAFEAYARAAMRAARAHGSAQAEATAETLEAERSVYGLTAALDEAGAAGLAAGQKIAAGMEQSSEAAARAAERVREAAERTREAVEKVSEPTTSVVQWVDPSVWENMTESGQREIKRRIDESFRYMWTHRTWSGGKNIVQDQLQEQIRQIEKAVEALDDLERRYLSGGLTDQIAAQVQAIRQQVGGFIDLSQWSVAQAAAQAVGASQAPTAAPQITVPAVPAPAPVTVQSQISGGRTEELLSEVVRYLAEIAGYVEAIARRVSGASLSPEQLAAAVVSGLSTAGAAS
jgi:TP901 family phage tail tape measure protein